MNRHSVIAYIDTFVRLLMLGIIWLGILGMLALVRVGGVFFMAAFTFLGSLAFLVSHTIMARQFLIDPEAGQPAASPRPRPASTADKPKRDSLADMFDLLDESDRYDVQQRIKQRLINRLDDADEEEFSSFAELIDTPDQRKRK